MPNNHIDERIAPHLLKSCTFIKEAEKYRLSSQRGCKKPGFNSGARSVFAVKNECSNMLVNASQIELTY